MVLSNISWYFHLHHDYRIVGGHNIRFPFPGTFFFFYCCWMAELYACIKSGSTLVIDSIRQLHFFEVFIISVPFFFIFNLVGSCLIGQMRCLVSSLFHVMSCQPRMATWHEGGSIDPTMRKVGLHTSLIVPSRFFIYKWTRVLMLGWRLKVIDATLRVFVLRKN